MDQRERYIDCLTFKKVDRIPNMELGVWPETIERWRTEGMAWWVRDLFTLHDHFGMDKSFNCDWMHISNGVFPDPEFSVIEETEEWEIVEDGIGNKLKRYKKNASIPQYIRFAVENSADFEKIRPKLDPAAPERYADDYDADVRGRALRGEVRGINFTGLFGFPRGVMGLEGYCVAIYEEPELAEAMLESRVDMAKGLYKRAFKNKDIDYVQMWEDMAYKTAPLISPDFIERHMADRYAEITKTFRDGGVRLIMMDCDGNVEKIMPMLRKCGIDGLYPCEIAAGSDPVRLRRMFPGVSLSGGVDKRALSANGRDGVKSEFKRLKPLLKDGGFIPYVDHFIPPDISYETFCYYCALKCDLMANPGMKI